MTQPQIHSRSTMPLQGRDQNQRTTPQPYARTVRNDFKRVITTGFGGQFMPIVAVPLLREDRLLSTTYRFAFDMAETSQMLINPVRVAVHMWFVPKLAFERFLDLGHLNRSYFGKQEVDGSVTPWFQTHEIDDGHAQNPETLPFYRMLGAHSTPGRVVNTDYVEAYNAIWNYVARETSPSLTTRDALDTSIAPAFWAHSAMRHVKPTFDQALIHGEVDLDISEQEVPVTGIGVRSSQAASLQTNVRETDAAEVQEWMGWENNVATRQDPAAGRESFPDIRVKFGAEVGATVSLANIELAKRTAAFARARQAYQGLDDDQVIDLLMSGVRMPEEGLQRPVLLGRRETIYGMSQRYATDSENLDKSVTTGQTMLDLTVAVPQVNTGGIVMGICEILPEQLYERQQDAYLSAVEVSNLPDRMVDELDLEPVEVVHNGDVDTDHSDPEGVFGYAPLNRRWQRECPNIGGLFYRPRAGAPWNENRDRIWAVETEDPVLGDDFYLASNIHHQVFADADTDPFEVSVNGMSRIEGLTFFGPALRESTGDYEHVKALADTSRIELPAPDAEEEDGDA